MEVGLFGNHEEGFSTSNASVGQVTDEQGSESCYDRDLRDLLLGVVACRRVPSSSPPSPAVRSTPFVAEF